MKKTILIIALALALMIPSSLWAAAGSCASSLWAAAGSCVQTPYNYAGGGFRVTLVCTGGTAGETGTIPTQTIDTDTMLLLTGIYYLYQVEAKPTAGGTAPDAGDVAVLMSGVDQLGAKGVDLIHATETRATFPYSAFMSSYAYPLVRSAITVTVANQITASANFTIELIFVR